MVNPSIAREANRDLVIVTGVGTIGSAVAHALFGAGFRVVLVQESSPATLRWGMSFSDAVTEGTCVLDGIRACLAAGHAEALAVLDEGRMIPVLAEPLEAAAAGLRPGVLVDARVKGAGSARSLRGLTPFSIGVGPRFSARETVDLVVESRWGPQLGRRITEGAADATPCSPELIEGLGWARFAAAPVDGAFRAEREIGQSVRPGQRVGTVSGHCVRAPIAGRLRGMARPGTYLVRGEKVIEIDPRMGEPQITGIGWRAAVIAESVLSAVAERRLEYQAQIGVSA